MEQTARTILGSKLVMLTIAAALVADALLRDAGWGVNFALFVAFCVAALILFAKRTDLAMRKDARGALLAAACFSLLFIWREAPELKLVNALAVFSLMGLATLAAVGRKLSVAPIQDFAIKALGLWAAFLGDFFILIFEDVKWAQAMRQSKLGSLAAVARGIVLAVPLILIFGALLASADAGFEKLATSLGDLDPQVLSTHVAAILIGAVLFGGFSRRLLMPSPPMAPKPATPYVLAPSYHEPFAREPAKLGGTETAIVLGALNLLFACFVWLQLPYLFGGSDIIRSTANLGIGSYARRGFFELVAVVGLALPVLLGTRAVLNENGERLWRVMASVMTGLLLVVMASAAQRMFLYVDMYALSTQRIYVFAALAWMALTLVWFLATTVRGTPDRFAFGAYVALVVILVALNCINPDGLVARVNVEGRRADNIDATYLAGLSKDATPELVRLFDRLPKEGRSEVAESIRYSSDDWRSWTISRQLAQQATASRANMLRAEAAKLTVVASAP